MVKNGVSVENMKTAGWSNAKTFYWFYNRPVHDKFDSVSVQNVQSSIPVNCIMEFYTKFDFPEGK